MCIIQSPVTWGKAVFQLVTGDQFIISIGTILGTKRDVGCKTVLRERKDLVLRDTLSKSCMRKSSLLALLMISLSSMAAKS